MEPHRLKGPWMCVWDNKETVAWGSIITALVTAPGRYPSLNWAFLSH